MTNRQLDEERIFHIARGIDAVDIRSGYLTQICAGDQALRERVEALLDADQAKHSLLESKPSDLPTTAHSVITESPGDQIGRYKLLQRIGDGGFGVVYMAEQCRPVRRKVALKVIKPGMDTQSVIARFEAERQALALMDHINIAKVFDGGATDSGRPYFVMELVKGLPICEFCDANKFSIHQRLRLFIDVCHAIQHAHQKGIIHRDIKPSNVLVTLHDGKPVPKVIDFGIAKAISQQLTEKTLFTAHGQMIGTPQYMSPEQAEFNGLDIDTRSDIYSLGILLYELLTGQTPLDPGKLQATSFRELQRMICEHEPRRPSQSFSAVEPESTIIAANRKTDSHKLRLALRGELDWIVIKSLEKERNRRYESSSALAADVENFLQGNTVHACPPSFAYRFQKFARRNRTWLLTGSTIVMLLMALTLTAFYQWNVEEKLRRKAENETQKAERALAQISDLQRQQLIEVIFSFAANDGFDDAKARINKSDMDSEDQRELLTILKAVEKISTGDPDEAVKILESLEPDPNDIILQALLANSHFDAGNYWTYFSYPVVQGSLEPNTAYEHLFVGKAMFWPDFQKSKEHLDDAVLLTHSPLSFTYRARALAHLAISMREDATKTKEPEELIEQAVNDINTATRLFQFSELGNEEIAINPTILGTHLLVLLYADAIYSQLAQDYEADQFQQEADLARKKAGEVMDAADHLSTTLLQQDLSKLNFVRGWLGFYLQRKAKRLEQQQAPPEKIVATRVQSKALLESTSFGPWLATANLVKMHPEDKRVHDEQQRIRNDTTLFKGLNQHPVCKALFLLTEDAKTGKQEVHKILQGLKNAPTVGQIGQICQIYILLGDLGESKEYAQAHLRDNPRLEHLPIAKDMLEYYAGKCTETKFLELSKDSGPETSRLLFVGLTHLARGNRKKALNYFDRLAHEGNIFTWEYSLAAAFAERLRSDASWPPWMPQTAP